MPAEMIPKKLHENQIKQYTRERKIYVAYAKALEEVLVKACKCSAPQALVQSRAKTVSSFAEKCVRKYPKYKRPAQQFTDLCGARVIVQTLEQVQAVRNFIEHNFHIVEKEDKGLLLQQDEFGYRDMHYIVQLLRNRPVGFSAEHFAQIGKRKAEIQVRTWVQHAWADTLHDRMYKAQIKLSPEINRTGALLAAIMEDGDRTFGRLAQEIDGMVANYSEYATKSEVAYEIGIQKLLLENEPDDTKKPILALQASRLLADSGEYGQVVELLDPHERKADGALGCEIRLHLGLALCKANRNSPGSSEFKRGLGLLLGVVMHCACTDVCEVPNLRKEQNILARAHAYLGWSFSRLKNGEYNARNHFQAALEREPENPYYLADVLGYEIFCTRNQTLAGSMRATILEAIQTCREHTLRNTEMPYACFTAGRLNLLLGSCANAEKPGQAWAFGYAALGWYARGIQHYLSGEHVVPADVLEQETEWMQKVNTAVPLPEQYSWSLDLLEIAGVVSRQRAGTQDQRPLQAWTRVGIKRRPALVIAGGAASMNAEMVKKIRPFLYPVLEKFKGTVISGGTAIGVPGCVGDIAAELEKLGRKGFRLLAYVPTLYPDDAPTHSAYNVTKFREFFSPDHILQGWKDLLAAGIDPEEVLLLGFGGGPLSAAEYQIGVALGAGVGVVVETGGAADAMAADPLWEKPTNFFRLPADWSSVRAFAIGSKSSYNKGVLDAMAMNFHENYVAGSAGRLPSNMRPWDQLHETYQTASREQAKYSVEILEAAGFGVRKVKKPVVFKFEKSDLAKIEQMAEMEHGRWNAERLRDGWRYGAKKDEALKLHNCIVPWGKLPEDIKHYDRDAVRLFPTVLAKAGLEIFRLKKAAPKGRRKK
jgi:ppGpp synthetase/RelA/SpoT-type nucleotidyltranferase